MYFRRRVARVSALVACVAGALGWVAACSSPGDPAAPRPGGRTSGGGGDDLFDAGGLPDGPPPPDAPGLCGNQLHEVIVDAPNLYFVLDRSGSMAAPAPGGTRYEAVRDASIDLVRKLGMLVNVGAALFPKETRSDGCEAGGQVMSVQPGTPVDAVSGNDGATTKAFASATKSEPVGGTPTAATLEALDSKLSALPGRTIVLLATDGGPNCNGEATCDADQCMTNIEGECPREVGNCCEPNGPAGPWMCVDGEATVSAVAALAALDVPVYVIGIPGSEIYADVLDEMAIVGKVPKPGPPFYYRVDDLSALGEVLGSIASVVVSCEFTLPEAPPEEGMTNVYLDAQVLAQDPTHGWTWEGDTVIVLHGDACARLKAGQVGQVQIVSGCPTEVAK
jgi:hypothetical protein